jgi:hypothetical protein
VPCMVCLLQTTLVLEYLPMMTLLLTELGELSWQRRMLLSRVELSELSMMQVHNTLISMVWMCKELTAAHLNHLKSCHFLIFCWSLHYFPANSKWCKVKTDLILYKQIMSLAMAHNFVILLIFLDLWLRPNFIRNCTWIWEVIAYMTYIQEGLVQDIIPCTMESNRSNPGMILDVIAFGWTP